LRRLASKVKDSLQTYFPVTEFYLEILDLMNYNRVRIIYTKMSKSLIRVKLRPFIDSGITINSIRKEVFSINSGVCSSES